MKAVREPVAVLFAALLLSVACSKKEPENRYVEPPPPPVTVATPAKESMTLSKEWTGKTDADIVEIRTRVTGFIKAIHFTDGQDVAAGDLLVEIDPLPFEAARDRATAEVTAAVAKLNLTEAEVNRYRELVAFDAASETEVDQKEAEFEVSKAGKAQAEAALRTTEIDLGYTKITAPIAGKITESIYTVGALVGAGESTLLATLVQLKPMYCYFSPSEQELLQYQKDKREGRAQATADGKSKVYLGLSDETGNPHEGVLDYIEPRLDETTGTIRLRASFENTDDALIPGLFARIRIARTPQDVLFVPESVIQFDQGGRYVLVVGAGDVVERRDVVLGELIGAKRIILTGLDGSESVIVNGQSRARTGAKVAPSAAAPTPAPAAPATASPSGKG